MDTEETFFLALKNHRESKQITLDEISEFTKINPKYLHAIEEGNFNIIPNIYMRLFIRSYTKYIGADHNQALADYELHTTGKIQPKFSEENNTKDISSDKKNNTAKPANSTGIYNDDFQVNYKQILKIGSVILAIFIAFLLLKNISKEDPKKSVDNPDISIDSTSVH